MGVFLGQISQKTTMIVASLKGRFPRGIAFCFPVRGFITTIFQGRWHARIGPERRSEVLIFPLSEAHLLPSVEKRGLARARFTTFIVELFL